MSSVGPSNLVGLLVYAELYKLDSVSNMPRVRAALGGYTKQSMDIGIDTSIVLSNLIILFLRHPLFYPTENPRPGIYLQPFPNRSATPECDGQTNTHSSSAPARMKDES